MQICLFEHHNIILILKSNSRHLRSKWRLQASAAGGHQQGCPPLALAYNAGLLWMYCRKEQLRPPNPTNSCVFIIIVNQPYEFMMLLFMMVNILLNSCDYEISPWFLPTVQVSRNTESFRLIASLLGIGNRQFFSNFPGLTACYLK